MTKQEKQDIMDKALRDYPTGTIYNFKGKEIKSCGRWHFGTNSDYCLYNSLEGPGRGNWSVWEKDLGWCKIISLPQPEIINDYLIF